MSITIQLPTSFEKQLRDNANREGLSMERFIANLLVAGVTSLKAPAQKTLTESELLQRINLNVSQEELEEFARLNGLRVAEQLSAQEHEQLIVLIHRIEIAHAERMKYVVALANLRGVEIEELMIDLGLVAVGKHPPF